MEKKDNLMVTLMDMDYRDLIRCIVTEARAAAQNIPAFAESGNGCIRITMVPLCQEIDTWLGGLSEFDENGKIVDVNEYEFVRTIAPGGSHTIQYKCPDGSIEPVNCYGYSALKTAYLSRLRKLGIHGSEDEEAEKHNYFCEENGWSKHAGSVVVTVSLLDRELFRYYNCVSGAESKEDEACAWQSARKSAGFLRSHNPKFSVKIQTGGIDD